MDVQSATWPTISMTPVLAQSYAYCERLARREAGNFYHAFRVLPGEQRRAMCALYAFLRLSDDISDGPGTDADKSVLLNDWRRQFDGALQGDYSHRIHPALHHMIEHYEIPRRYLDDALVGIAMDLGPVDLGTFSELYRYSYHVASVVGLACIHIWGFSGEDAKHFAEQAGIALQLTNILRDLGEDIARQRVYLPREDRDRFGYSSEDLQQGLQNDQFRALMQFQVARARSYYEAAAPLAKCLPPPGRAVYQIMIRTYRGLLEAIEHRDYDVFSSRVRLSSWRKLGFVMQALPVRWGLA